MLTREQFQTIADQGFDAVFLVLTAMHQQIDFLTARVKELEERLDKDSHNSHKPPSSLEETCFSASSNGAQTGRSEGI